MEDELFTITVNLAGNRFPVTVRREDEFIYREAAKSVKEKIDSYRERHPQLPYESVLIMVAYHFAVESGKQKHQGDVGPVVTTMGLLDKELDKYLKELS